MTPADGRRRAARPPHLTGGPCWIRTHRRPSRPGLSSRTEDAQTIAALSGEPAIASVPCTAGNSPACSASSSAGVVTSAAVIMVAVFSILATLPTLDTKTLGVGLAAAVLIDATVVRGILLPAARPPPGERCC